MANTSIKALLNKEVSVEMVKVTIGDYSVELTVEDAHKLATIAVAMSKESRSTKTTTKDTKNTTKKSTKSSKKFNGCTHDLELVYEVVKCETYYYINAKRADGQYTKTWAWSLGQDEIIKVKGITPFTYKNNHGKDSVHYGFKTKKACEEAIKSLKTVFTADECNTKLNTLYGDR